MAEILDSWEAIIASIDDGTYAIKYNVGDYKPLDLGAEGIINMEIAGFDVDVLCDGTGNAPITFIGRELLASNHIMNPTLEGLAGAYVEGTGAIGGWEKSEMKTYLNETIKPLIPSMVRERIQKVSKSQTAYDTTGQIYTQNTEDTLWLPSLYELNTNTYGGLFVERTDRLKMKTGADNYSAWWLRNASEIGKFNGIDNTNGYEMNLNASTSIYSVALCFCLGTPEQYTIQRATLINIANAIRSKNGSKEKMRPSKMAEEIEIGWIANTV